MAVPPAGGGSNTSGGSSSNNTSNNNNNTSSSTNYYNNYSSSGEVKHYNYNHHYQYTPPTLVSAVDFKHVFLPHAPMMSIPAIDPVPAGGGSASSPTPNTDYTTYPLGKQNGRTYFRDPDSTYPLPCDVPEIHRQSLHSLIIMTVWGGPFCSPTTADNPPKKVLELGCGSGLWTSACHEYFANRGQADISFTGLDIISLAPELQQKQGIDWQFKKHDLRKNAALPFADESFDFVFIKDVSLCGPTSDLKADGTLSEPLRVLKSGGVLEMWDSDMVYRTLLPNPPVAPGKLSEEYQEQAEITGTYTISSATPFTNAQNKYLNDYNTWIQKAFDARRLNTMPCATIGLAFSSEADSFQSSGSRRVAIPLGEVKWEQKQNGKPLTADQMALRQTTLLTVVQLIESMEPLLMEASGKGQAEWDRWWTGMTTDLMQKGGVASGECLEVGAWWGRKK
ncbi:SAM binding domain-containing protein containing protein [Nannizzia gypsea CBS 118893]|uniref:SAM binding domain-containing protein containing protein n=1 Tax=Arthroderma gypseum (strain ATCC MYA-4604 / CBS 118893) TaxID=535722 RepID=E5R2J4_ARTGP|nr:SAM binding domain-containing protein containing protein [Nannizzia gypsea CBS 118893]EFQ98652.1 SAM binding domain-containing protein containing protein [Nannizzia gypsea CBS 118893]